MTSLDLGDPSLTLQPVKSVQLSDPVLKDIARILGVVIDACPGHTEALYLAGKARYLSGMVPLGP